MIKIELDQLKSQTSNTFCMAKFHEATMWLYSGKIASCHHNPFHNTGFSVDTFYNTPEKRRQQQAMLAGEQPDPCNYCWKMEAQGLTSDRYYKSISYLNPLPAENYLDPEFNFKPRVLELAFEKTCNLGCSYCNADFSTQWVNDIKNNGVYVNIVTDSRKHYQRPADSYHSDSADPAVFWRWLDTVIDELDIIRITGGEPMLHEQTFNLIDHVREKNPDIKVAINSNLCQKPVVLERFKQKIKGIKTVSLYTSNESADHVAELLRDGMNYQEWLANIKFMDDAGLDHIFVMTTIGAVCLQNFDKFLMDIIQLRQTMKTPISVNFNFLTYPEFQSFQALDQMSLDSYYEKYQRFFAGILEQLNTHETERYQRLLTLLDRHQDPNQPALAEDLLSFFRQFAQRRTKQLDNIEVIGRLSEK